MREPPVLDAFDEPDVPQGPTPVQADLGQPGHQLAQLPGAAGGRHGDAMQMVIQMEIGVGHQQRLVQPEGHLLELHGELRHQRYPLGQEATERLEPPPGSIPGVDDAERAHVHRPCRSFGRQHEGIAAAESRHHPTPLVVVVAAMSIPPYHAPAQPPATEPKVPSPATVPLPRQPDGHVRLVRTVAMTQREGRSIRSPSSLSGTPRNYTCVI